MCLLGLKAALMRAKRLEGAMMKTKKGSYSRPRKQVNEFAAGAYNRLNPNAVPRALELYRTECNAASDSSTDLRRYSIREYACKHGLRECDVTRSFRRMLEVVPGMSEHVEACRRGNVYGGESFIDYRLDAVGYLVWLYWRAVKGRLPEELFGGRKRDE